MSAAITNGARKSRRLKPSSRLNSGESSSGLRILYSTAAILSFNRLMICPLLMVPLRHAVFANDILLYHMMDRLYAGLQGRCLVNKYKMVYLCDNLHIYFIFIFKKVQEFHISLIVLNTPIYTLCGQRCG